jgi:hypothetical protein
MLWDVLSVLMNVTWLPRATMMSFGVTAPFTILIVFVATAPAGVVLGVVLGEDELLGLLLLQAATARAAAAHAPARDERLM